MIKEKSHLSFRQKTNPSPLRSKLVKVIKSIRLKESHRCNLWLKSMLEIKIRTVDWQQRQSRLFFSIITFTLCKYNHEEVFMLAFFPACLFSWYYFYYHKFWTQSDWYEWDALRSWYDKNFLLSWKTLNP